jgi:hypothetical protein
MQPVVKIQGVFRREVVSWLVLLGMIVLPFTPLFLYYPVSEWLSYRQHRSGFDAVYEKEILPGMAWVRQYHQEKGKLPTEAEYREAHKRTDGYGARSWLFESRPEWQETPLWSVQPSVSGISITRLGTGNAGGCTMNDEG